jgi:AraC family transcriptional activator of pobA
MRHPSPAPRGIHGTVERFQDLVEREFRRWHRVDEYAARLRVSPGHLSVLCKSHLGHSASGEIHRRLLIEARRLLLYTDKPAFAVARELGFADPAYFGRFFKREQRQTPRAYRVLGVTPIIPSTVDGS